MYPEAEAFLAHFPGVVHEFGGQAYTDGVVREVGSYAGVALWMPPGLEPGGEGLLELYRRTIARVRGDGGVALGREPTGLVDAATGPLTARARPGRPRNAGARTPHGLRHYHSSSEGSGTPAKGA